MPVQGRPARARDQATRGTSTHGTSSRSPSSTGTSSTGASSTGTSSTGASSTGASSTGTSSTGTSTRGTSTRAGTTRSRSARAASARGAPTSPTPIRNTVAFLAPLVLLAAIYLGVAWLTGRQLPAQASVEGVGIGGMTPEAARDRLSRKLADLTDDPVTVDLAGTAAVLRADHLGLGLDLDATLDGATGFTLDPRVVWSRLNGGGPLPLRSSIDTATATAALRPALARVERPVTQAAITLSSGRIETVRPREGLRVDVPATLTLLAQSWPAQQRVVAPVRREQPQVGPAALDAAVSTVARPALAAPLVVVLGRRPTTLPIAEVAPALSMVTEGGTLALRVDGAALAPVLRERVPGLETEPVDATVRLVSGAPQVVPAVPGTRLDERATAGQVLAALTVPRADSPSTGRPRTTDRGTGAASPSGAGAEATGASTPEPGASARQTVGRAPTRRAGIVTAEVAAQVGTADATAWGVQHRLAQVAVPTSVEGLPAAAEQSANVAAGARALAGQDGRLLRPGESLTLSSVLGDPSGSYADAPEPTGDPALDPSAGVIRWRPGGGLSQLAGALYAAGWSAGVDLGPRRTHPVHLPAYPAGLDAVYAFGEADVTLTNPGPGALLVAASTTDREVTVTLWGRRDTVVREQTGPRLNVAAPGPTSVVETDPGGSLSCVDQPLSATGFDLEVRREVVRGRTARAPESQVVHYAALTPLSCVAPPAPSGAWIDPNATATPAPSPP